MKMDLNRKENRFDYFLDMVFSAIGSFFVAMV